MEVEDVNSAIGKHLNTKNMIIAAVTKDADGFRKSLVENSPSPITYDSPKPEAILEEDKMILKYPLAIEEKKVRIIPAEKIFE
jgi:zinc protease